MSPASYYCWLSERRWLWLFRKRFQPKPDQNYPILIALVMPLAVTGLALLLFAALISLVTYQRFPPRIGFAYWVIGSLAFTAAALHWGFTWLAWNQRAARLRASDSTPATPPRPGALTLWLLGPLYLFLLAVVTPIALITAVENVRGAVKWRSVRTELLSRGERLDVHQVAPKEPPTDQNFFSVAPFNRLMEPRPPNAGAARSFTGVNTNTLQEVRIFALPEKYLPKREADATTPVPLADWARAFREAATNQASVNGSSPLSLPRYAPIPSGASDGAAVLAAISIANAEVAAICEASSRPRAVAPIAWNDATQALIPHLAILKSLHNYLNLRVAAKLSVGDRAGAFADAECSLRLADALREEPLLISQLVRFAQVGLAARTVWRGIAVHAWDDAQLKTLQQMFQQFDLLGGIAYALEGERAIGLLALDQWMAGRTSFEALSAAESGEVGGGDSRSPNLMPSGWIRQNQGALAQEYQRLVDIARQWATNPPPAGFLGAVGELKAIEESYAKPSVAWGSPYDIFIRMLMPAVGNSMSKVLRAETTARCAETACALERYRLRNKSYPESLQALIPEFLSDVPLDPIDNQPLRYARTEDGLFRLWSVGEDGRDDGGRLRAPDAKKNSRTLLDWPWP